jgi:NAD(P)-dependent dehydrogenase (short-subunit alcohol dehydrogenase family)
MTRTAIVTGGSRGIGAAISVALKNAGYKVAANYAGNDEAAAKFRDETGIPVYKWSVADYDACVAGIARVEADLGPVDVLVNNAGITRDAMFHRMTPQQWREVIDTNLSGVFNRPTIPRPRPAISASPRRWRRRARAPASPSTPSAPATSPRKWSRPSTRRC